MLDQKYVDSILAIHQKLFKKIRKAGVKTGSKVFGGWKDGSDIDFIMPLDFQPDFDSAVQTGIAFYSHKEGYRTNEFLSAYMKTDQGTILNLLWMQTEETFRIWTEATAILKDLVEKYPSIAKKMQNKKNRVRFFEMIKEMLT